MPIDPTTQEGRALQKAVAVRSARASLKRELKANRLDGYGVLSGDNAIWEETVRGMQLGKFLELLPGVGPVTVFDALDTMALPYHMTLQGMTFERRRELAEVLRDAVDGPGLPTPEAVE